MGCLWLIRHSEKNLFLHCVDDNFNGAIMRKLSKRQKKMIDTWFNENWDGAGSVTGIGDMPIDTYEKMERLNNHETLWQNAERYVMDKVMSETLGQPQYF